MLTFLTEHIDKVYVKNWVQGTIEKQALPNLYGLLKT